MDTLNLRDELCFLSDAEYSNIFKPHEKKLIGVVQINDYDKDHNLINIETHHNEIALPGSIFMLEKLFNKRYSETSFYFPDKINLNTTEIQLDNKFDGTGSIKDTQIIGFVIGNGGCTSRAVVAPSYAVEQLEDENGNISCIPFLKIEKDEEVSGKREKYFLESINNSTLSDKNPKYFFGKRYEENNVSIAVYDTAGTPSEITSINEAKIETTPIVARAEIKLKISENDVYSYYGDSDSAVVSQIGLVSGVTSNVVPEGQSPYDHFTNIRLITMYNFKERDFNNSENSLEMIYRVYCI